MRGLASATSINRPNRLICARASRNVSARSVPALSGANIIDSGRECSVILSSVDEFEEARAPVVLTASRAVFDAPG